MYVTKHHQLDDREAMFSLMDTAMKLLSAHYPAMQVTALRALSSLPLVCWVMVPAASRPPPRSPSRQRWSKQRRPR